MTLDELLQSLQPTGRDEYQGSARATGTQAYQQSLIDALLSQAGVTQGDAGNYGVSFDAPVPDQYRMYQDTLTDPSGNVAAKSDMRYEAPWNLMKDLVLPAAAVFGGGYLANGLLGGAAGGSGAAAGGAASSITPEMLAAANATADPIAALNAAAGWTGVDSAYLASIGAAAPTSSSVTQNMINAANETADPIAALNNSAGWTGVDKAYLASIGLPELGGAIRNIPPLQIDPSESLKPLLSETLPPLPSMSAPGMPSIPGAPSTTGVPPVSPPKSMTDDIMEFLKDNKALLPIAGALLGGAGGGGSSGGYQYSGPMPNITRGNWSPAAPTPQYMQPQQRGLLNIPSTGTPNSGLWRYLQGG